jgi:hypothetical protein
MPLSQLRGNKFFGDSIYFGHLNIPTHGFKYKSLVKE